MANYTVENTKFINVEGTDALLKVLRVRKRKSDVTLTKIIPISKSSLLNNELLLSNWLTGAIMSATVSIWAMMFTTLAFPFIPILFILGAPLFATIFEHLHNWMTKPVDFTSGGREEDKKVYQDPEAMPVFDLSEEVFNSSDSRIIDAYNKQYEKFVKNNPELKLPNNTTGQEQIQEELNNEYVRDRSFTKVFYDDDNNGSYDAEEENDKYDVQELTHDETESHADEQAMQELLEELNNMPANEADSIIITDKRTFKNSGYFQQ